MIGLFDGSVKQALRGSEYCKRALPEVASGTASLAIGAAKHLPGAPLE